MFSIIAIQLDGSQNVACGLEDQAAVDRRLESFCRTGPGYREFYVIESGFRGTNVHHYSGLGNKTTPVREF